MKKAIAVLGFVVCCLSGIRVQIEPGLYAMSDRKRMEAWADSVFDKLSYDKRLGQLFMVVASPKPDGKNMERLRFYVDTLGVGGVLFSQGEVAAQAALTNWLQSLSHTPLFIGLDGEWGLSMRLHGVPRFPRNMLLGAGAGDSLIREYGREVGRECREMGIHINFAPLLDVNSNIMNPVIGTRSFGEDPQAVASKGAAYAGGLESAGVLSVAKHFPGHGDTSDDSHYTLPVVGRSRAGLDSVELLPFVRYIREGYGGIMTAHLHVPALDNRKNYPASLSETVVTGLLKKTLGFEGLVFTDALVMKGAVSGQGQGVVGNTCVKALLAGNDLLLSPPDIVTDIRAVKQAIDEGVLPLKDVESKCLKILRYKYLAGLAVPRPIETRGLSERINTSHAACLAGQLNEAGLTLLKNEADILPLKQLEKKKIAVLSLGDDTGNAFQAMLNRYDSVACFSLNARSSATRQQRVYKALQNYDLIICGIHSVRIPESEYLRRLTGRKDVALAFFTLPYFCKDYQRSIAGAQAVVMAYENGDLTQEYAAQLIFGGVGAKGKLPVGIPEMYSAGAGLFTQQTRLGYRQPEEVGMDAVRLAAIDTIVAEGLAAKAFPGCQVLVAKDNQIIYSKSFGYYDYSGRQPVSDNTLYDIASLSKVVGTLPAVMELYDRKDFALNDRIDAFVPPLVGSKKGDITIEELLLHRSGLAPTLYHYARIPRALVSDSARKGFSLEVARRYFVNDSYRDTLVQEIRRSKPGVRGKYVYSCLNFILLQNMVENLRKQPIDLIVKADFYAPLGARRITYNPLKRFSASLIAPTENDTTIRRQLLRGYVHDEVAAFQGGVSGNAGLFANANDLAKLLQLYLNLGEYGGERYLSASTLRLFTQSTATARRTLGFDKPDPRNVPLAPPSAYGHTGFTGTCCWLDPDNHILYIFLSNRVHPSRNNNRLSSLSIRPRIHQAIYQALQQ